jgi:thiol-disulfide isomerase/thioredoxin
MTGNWMPLDDLQVRLISKTITTPEIRQALLNSSKKMEQKLAAMEVENRNKKGYWYHESPKVQVDSLFGAILAQHKGKLLFVDFWATWCSPCKEGIQRMKPLKEEYIGKNVDFIYITGPSSPQKTYDLMIPDIKGQHYRVTKEGWSYLCKQFKITGIPHYMLVDQLGYIVGDNVDSMGHSNELLRNLFDSYLKK